MLVPGDPGYDAGVQHGLIAASADQSTGVVWIIGLPTGTLIGNTSTAYGTGQANTNYMIAAVGFTGGAAKVCNDYTNTDTGTGVYSDWYLPSIGELDHLYTNRAAIVGFSNEYKYYWSSSEYNNWNAWDKNFINGNMYGSKINPNALVRAVRTF